MTKKQPVPVSFVSFLFLFLFLLNLTAVAATPARATQAGPTLLKRTVTISTKRFLRYWPNPRAAEPQYNTWSWTPKVYFEILGPVPGGGQLIFEASTPDGKQWVSFNLRTPEAGDDELVKISGPDLDDNELEKKAITQTGLFPFRIVLKNALAGTNEAIFSGKFKVATYAPDQAIPEYKGKQEFYVVQDWRLPVGFIWYDPTLDENVPNLSVQMWFRGTRSGDKIEGVLFYKGQQVATTLGYNEDEISTGVGDPQGRWGLWKFGFAKVRGYNNDTSANQYDGVFFLDKNPGDYEIKVLRLQKLARTAAFSVGADGRIVDNGIAKQHKIGGIRMILPVKVIADQDVKYDPLSWKTDAFYGHPLSGFVAP
jgi:hypothetical protein